MTEKPIVAKLRSASEGLSFTSETDAGFEAFAWSKSANELPPEAVREIAGHEADAPVATMTLKDFFRAVPKADRSKFDQLAKTLGSLLTNVRVVKVGEVSMDVYIVGRTADGSWAGLKTEVVET